MSGRPPIAPSADRIAAYAAPGAAATVNGIDYLEVVPATTPGTPPRLRVTFVRALPATGFPSPSAVRIVGGERISGIAVTATALDPGDSTTLLVDVDRIGDFSTYRLVVGSAAQQIDPQLSGVDLVFHVECATRFDCRPAAPPAADAREDVAIDYLTKDYPTFRRAMLDRLALIAPTWQERHAADLGVTLVEILAYGADRLSYRQDAAAAEAYIGTARRRVSVRRHAKLVDYAVHEGCNARAWVQLMVTQDAPLPLPKGTRLFTTLSGRGAAVAAGALLDRQVQAENAIAFETMADLPLFAAHTVLPLYAWSESEATLAPGTTSATLDGAYPALAPGMCLILAQVLGLSTGSPDDADPSRRWPVVLTSVAVATDPLTGAPVTAIGWGAEDALPFALVLARAVTQDGETKAIVGAAAALGNVVLADAGQTVGRPSSDAPDGEPLGTVANPRRFRPALARAPLTWANLSPYDAHGRLSGSAAAAAATDPRGAGPALARVVGSGTVSGSGGAPVEATLEWTPYADLLDASIGPETRAFVVEVEDDGTARLRFGDGVNGARPAAGIAFGATYRVGNGSGGNVGAEAIAHVAASVPGLVRVRNPLPAGGGSEPESVARVRADAPWAFRTQARAVTLDDYARTAEQHPAVLRAAALQRWTGSWSTVFVIVETRGARGFDAALRGEVIELLDRYRMAGTDIEVEPARIVAVELGLHVCVDAARRAADVHAALQALFTDGVRADGTRGLLHPDAFLMGARLYLSPFVAAARNVAGVASVTVTRFGRADGAADGIAAGYLEAGRTEVFALRNNPDFPERGTLVLAVDGGR